MERFQDGPSFGSYGIRGVGEIASSLDPGEKIRSPCCKVVESNELRGYTERRRKKKFVDRGCRKIRLRGSFGRS